MAIEGEKQVALAIGAHPDDVEIHCAGTLRLLQAAGFELHVATMTLGDCGSKGLSAEQTCAVRRKEAESACRMLGAAYHYAGSHDFAIFNDDAHNRLVTALVRDVNPSLVLTHQPHDYIVDHEATSILVRNACFYAPAPNYDTSTVSESPAISGIPHLYYWDAVERRDIFGKSAAVEMYVDISREMEFKVAMLAEHESQREWLRAQHGIDEYLVTTKEWGRIRGGEASRLAGLTVLYAEAFRQHLGHAYPRNNLLLGVLRNHVITNPGY